ncbi:MAG TPA: signal peptidase I [Polyangiaceae bacterium]|nr:signal peptidase I [Polyangiaceae bacterium]
MRPSPGSWKASLAGYCFGGFWFVLLPGLLVLLLFAWCASPGAWAADLAASVRDQRVPAAIVLFTLAEMLLYHFRYWLPFAGQVAALGPPGLGREVREEHQHATQFVEQTERLLRQKRRRLARELPPSAHERIARSLAELRSALAAQPFDRELAREAFRAAQGTAQQHLSGFKKSESRRTLESLIAAVALALALRALVFEAFRIPSGSMLPTLQIGDHIFVNKLHYGPLLPFTELRLLPQLPPDRADVIVFEFPDDDPRNERQDFVKRVIALPGDVLESRQGHPIINGWSVPYCRAGRYQYGKNDGRPFEWAELDVEFLGDLAYLTLYAEDMDSGTEGPFRVGPGEVYVMGDNRNDSLDSRRWHHGAGGGVPYSHFRGRASRVWLPAARWMLPIMGLPQLPEGMPAELSRGVQACLAARPAQTLPPPPASSPGTGPLG